MAFLTLHGVERAERSVRRRDSDRCGSINLSGTTANACPNYSPGDEGCTRFAANGRDVVYKVNAVAGDSLYLDYVQSAADASIYIVSDCSNPAGSCVAGEDSTLVGGHETLSYEFTSSGTFYVILDSFSPAAAGPGPRPARSPAIRTASIHSAPRTSTSIWRPRGAGAARAQRLDVAGVHRPRPAGAERQHEGVPTELTRLELAGNSLDLGPVTLRLRP
jgi:hypothetical protein